ncbi:MAG: hypothetical protein ACE5FS_12265 [Paracoccaceae bacterium]
MADVRTGEIPDWYGEIFPKGPRQGFYQHLRNHPMVFVERRYTRLVVTFDNLSNVSDAAPDREPWAYKFCRDNDWSHLGIMAKTQNWYRDAELVETLQEMAARGFFSRFEEVFFAGTSMGGFAAIAFSSLSPGARVLAYSPQTTLDPALVPWEERFAAGRAQDWTLPHSDGAVEAAAAARVYIVYDPYVGPDRRHADRLTAPNVAHLKSFFSGHKSALFARKIGILKPLMADAADGSLDEAGFYAHYRKRKDIPWYLRRMSEALAERGKHDRIPLVTQTFRQRRRALAEAPGPS